MNKFPFVRWDRFTVSWNGREYQFYGWIERVDNYKDFILLTIETDVVDDNLTISSTTSSSAYSEEIAKILGAEDSHIECSRVESFFSGVINAIRL